MKLPTIIAVLAFLPLTGCITCSQGFSPSDCPFTEKPEPVQTSSLSNPAISPDGGTIAFEFNAFPRRTPVPGLYDWRTGRLTRADRPANFWDRREVPTPAWINSDQPLFKIATANPDAPPGSPRHQEIFRYQNGIRTQLTDLHATLYDLIVSPDRSAAVVTFGVPSGHAYNDLDFAVLDLRNGGVVRPDLLALVRRSPEFSK